MSTSKSTDSDDPLAPGTVMLHGDEDLYIVVDNGGGEVVVKELGNRRIRESRMFDLGDDCPVPECGGEVSESTVSEGRRRCSEGCLEWLPGRPVAGQDCSRCDEGTVVERDSPMGHYSVTCDNDDHDWFASGVIRWREAWMPFVQERVVERFSQSDSKDAGGDS